jgi:hypothetical protein
MEGANLRYIINTLVNVTVYPQCNNNLTVKKEKTYCIAKKSQQSPELLEKMVPIDLINVEMPSLW